MRALVAPDKFKGCLPAGAVAAHLASGLVSAGVDAAELPLADGGDGSVAAALAAGFAARAVSVADALGEVRASSIAVRADTAVIEIANTCGMSTLRGGVLSPLTASSRGFGEAIRQAVDVGLTRLVLALGGSASTDGGTGMLAALGYRFLDADGHQILPVGGTLSSIRQIDAAGAVDLTGVEIVVAGDVTNELTGPDGAAAVFGPQKGASAAEVAELDAGLRNLVTAFARSGRPAATGWARYEGSGAAGGCGFAALALGAEIVSGAGYFLDLLDFDGHVADSDLIVTGEGRLDRQTMFGKLPAEVARRSAGRPVIAVVGRNELGDDPAPFACVQAVSDLTTADTASDAALTAELLEDIGRRIGIQTRSERV